MLKNLGDRLRKARELKGMTQVYVKSRTGLNNKTLSGYENNVSEPDSATLRLLADLYEVSTDWLYGRGGTPANITEEENEILEGFNKLNKQDQQYILDLINRLKSNQN